MVGVNPPVMYSSTTRPARSRSYSLISPISLLSRKKAKRRCDYSTTLMPLIAQPFNPLQEQARVCSFSSTIFQSSFSTIVFNGS